MGRSAVPLAGLDGSDLLRAWEAMAAVDPMRRGAAVLDAVLTDLPAPAEALPVGSCDTLLLALRVGTFGAPLSGVTTCPVCETDIDLDIDAAQILASLPAVEAVELSPDPVTRGDCVVRYRPATVADLSACTGRPDASERILARCITSATVDGSPVDVDELPLDVLDAVADAIAAADQAADLRLRASCPSCGEEHSTRLDVTEFFGAEITAAATALLLEVDELATRYGWSEAQILALSPTRRRTYLELR